MIADMVFMGLMLFACILLLWISTGLMVDSRRISPLLPFFFSGMMLALSSSLTFNGIFSQEVWFAVELSWAFLFLWILVNLRRENG